MRRGGRFRSVLARAIPILAAAVPGALIATAALAAPASLAAQDPPPDSVVPLEPLVVRVLRSSVGLGTPYPVTVAAGEELTRATGGAFLEEALRAVPGVQIQNRFNLASGERIAVRGFGARAQFGITGVRVVVDGVPATLADGQTALDHLDLTSLGRVEVLRGPGSALYGNAAGGVLHFETAPPPATGREVSVQSAGGSWGFGSFGASVAGTSGSLGYRASVSGLRFDGYRSDPVAGGDAVFGDARRALLNGVVRAPLAGGTLRLAVNGMDMEAHNPGSISRSLAEEDPDQAYRFNVIQDTREDVRQGQAGLTWDGAVGGADGEVSIWGLHRDFFGAIPPSIVEFDRNAAGARAVARTPTGGPLSFGAGVEVETQRDDRVNFVNEGGERGALELDQDETVDATGVFAQARFDASRRVGVLAGLRYDRFHFDARDDFLSDGDDSGDRVMHAVSPSAGVVVAPTRRLEAFASVATSFETPTTTQLTNRPDGSGGFNGVLDPTRGVTVEGGMRGRVGRNWTFEATLFRTELSDELVAFEVPSAPGRSFYRNAGESKHTGWEVTADGRPAPWAAVRVAWTRVDARFESYAVDGNDFSGNRLPGLAPNRVDAVLTLEGASTFLSLRGLHTGAVPVDDANTAEAEAYTLADVRLGLRDGTTLGDARLTPWLAVSNVFDRRYDTSVVVNAFGGRFFEPGPGRSFRVGVSLTWVTP